MVDCEYGEECGPLESIKKIIRVKCSDCLIDNKCKLDKCILWDIKRELGN